MSPRASDLAARMAASAAGARREPPAQSLQPEPAGPPQEAPSSIVKFTFKMSRELHRFARQFALDNDTEVSTLVRTLLSRIETDPVFAEEVRTFLQEHR